MADQNQDGKGMISGGTQAGAGERLRDDVQATGSPGMTSTTGASSAAGSSGGMGSDMSGGAGTSMGMGSMKEGTTRLADNAKQYAGDMASKAKEKSRTLFDQQKETAVGQVTNVASAIRSTASHLEGEGQDQVARYVGMLADQLESLGGRLREKDLDTLVSDAQNLARRSPATFFLGTVAVGFLLARFLKSSSTSGVEYRGYSGMEDDQWRSAGATSSGAYAGGTTGGGMGGTMGGAAGGSTGGRSLTGTTGATGTSGTTGSGGAMGGSSAGGRGVGADGTPGTSGTTMGSSATPVNGSGAGGTSI